MSVMTGGYRFPSCAKDYTEMFRLMSQEVIAGSDIPCAFEIPLPDNGEDIDLATVEMTYRQPGKPDLRLSRVPDARACTDSTFFIENGRIELCAAACKRVESVPDATLSTLFGCSLDIR